MQNNNNNVARTPNIVKLLWGIFAIQCAVALVLTAKFIINTSNNARKNDREFTESMYALFSMMSTLWLQLHCSRRNHRNRFSLANDSETQRIKTLVKQQIPQFITSDRVPKPIGRAGLQSLIDSAMYPLDDEDRKKLKECFEIIQRISTGSERKSAEKFIDQYVEEVCRYLKLNPDVNTKATVEEIVKGIKDAFKEAFQSIDMANSQANLNMASLEAIQNNQGQSQINLLNNKDEDDQNILQTKITKITNNNKGNERVNNL